VGRARLLLVFVFALGVGLSAAPAQAEPGASGFELALHGGGAFYADDDVVGPGFRARVGYRFQLDPRLALVTTLRGGYQKWSDYSGVLGMVPVLLDVRAELGSGALRGGPLRQRWAFADLGQRLGGPLALPRRGRGGCGHPLRSPQRQPTGRSGRERPRVRREQPGPLRGGRPHLEPLSGAQCTRR
jgi:hypothetical protein